MTLVVDSIEWVIRIRLSITHFYQMCYCTETHLDPGCLFQLAMDCLSCFIMLLIFPEQGECGFDYYWLVLKGYWGLVTKLSVKMHRLNLIQIRVFITPVISLAEMYPIKQIGLYSSELLVTGSGRRSTQILYFSKSTNTAMYKYSITSKSPARKILLK